MVTLFEIANSGHSAALILIISFGINIAIQKVLAFLTCALLRFFPGTFNTYAVRFVF